MKRRSALLLVAVVGLAAAAGCARGGDRPSAGPPSATAPQSSSAGEPLGSPTGTAPLQSPAVWSSDPVRRVHEIPVPPVPTLLGVRAATHSEEGFDRIVFDFTGPLPGYEVRYVPEVVEDASGRRVSVPGRRFLQITFRPAQAHSEAGQSTVAARTATLNYPMLKAYAIVGDFEAVLSVALGLDDVVGFRVGELPGRIYLDVAA